MSENAMTTAVTSTAKLLKLDYIENEWTEFQKMMGVKVRSDGEQRPDGSTSGKSAA